jgi:23S rRNA (uracil1939-C5)-methyltransferase
MRKRKHVRSVRRAPRVEKGSGATLEVQIERILPGGVGLAHADGRTVLVGLAAPGDHLRVRVDRVRGSVAFASIVEIISPSPVRREPPCPYFGRCGGCDFQQLDYQAQLASKVEIIRDCLSRIARLDAPAEIPITGSPLAWRYRSRAQWQYDPRHKQLGYFERGTHRVCDVVECPVLVPVLEETLATLRKEMQAGGLPAYAEDFQAVAGDEGASLAPPVGQHLTTREVSRTINGYRYRFSAEGFFQINHELLAPLVASALGDADGESAVDLYCGAGLFTLPLASRFARVVGVEANATALRYARRNLSDAGLDNAEFIPATVSDWLKEHAEKYAPADFVLLDPPRSGVEDASAIEGILALRPRRIAYVSCDPATLARDLKGLTVGGYMLDSIAAFDMFPQTHHVETVVHLKSSLK